LLKNVKHVPFGDIEAMRRCISKKTAMVIVEPIMGEAGVIVPPDDYLQQLRQLCDKSAMIALGKAADLFQPGEHGSTFGGNPVTTAAALAAIKTIESKQLLKKVKKQGRVLIQELAMIEGVQQVRGAGLLIGIELGSATAQEITQKLLDRGVLVNAANTTTIRIAPALIVSDAQIKKFITIFREVLIHGN
jgi:acetylornithine/N-succinyldiaminopimelate aminotransferase